MYKVGFVVALLLAGCVNQPAEAPEAQATTAEADASTPWDSDCPKYLNDPPVPDHIKNTTRHEPQYRHNISFHQDFDLRDVNYPWMNITEYSPGKYNLTYGNAVNEDFAQRNPKTIHMGIVSIDNATFTGGCRSLGYLPTDQVAATYLLFETTPNATLHNITTFTHLSAGINEYGGLIPLSNGLDRYWANVQADTQVIHAQYIGEYRSTGPAPGLTTAYFLDPETQILHVNVTAAHPTGQLTAGSGSRDVVGQRAAERVTIEGYDIEDLQPGQRVPVHLPVHVEIHLIPVEVNKTISAGVTFYPDPWHTPMHEGWGVWFQWQHDAWVEVPIPSREHSHT